MNKKNYYTTTLIWLIFVVCLIFVVTNSAFVSQTISQVVSNTKELAFSTTTKIIGQELGTPMIQDAQGNINIMIVGYGGDGHAWGKLTDSIIIASFDPYNYSLAMISVPRDLIVNRSWYINKINSVFAYSYSKTKSYDSAAKSLIEKLQDISWLSIPYYALIDFQWFTDLLTSIGWVDVTIPTNLYDRAYPWPNASYTVFSIKSWYQHLDASTALKYARSRHSTSDFSRSERQQLIINAIIDKLTTGGLSITSIKTIYDTYQKYITSNIALNEMMWLLRYGSKTPNMFTFGYTYECSSTNRKTMQNGCLLYPVTQEEFNGMSWMLPRWSTINNISNYTDTKIFAQFVAHHQWLFNGWYQIRLHNATDPEYAKSFAYRSNIATNLAILLKRYGVNVQEVENSEVIRTTTLARITGGWNADSVIKNLQLFFPIDTISNNEATIDLSGNVLPQSIDIYLGNDFLDTFWKKTFNTYLNDAQQPHYLLTGEKA